MVIRKLLSVNRNQEHYHTKIGWKSFSVRLAGLDSRNPQDSFKDDPFRAIDYIESSNLPSTKWFWGDKKRSLGVNEDLTRQNSKTKSLQLILEMTQN